MTLQLREGDSAGRIVHRQDVSGFILTETIYPADFQAPSHSHEFGYFFTVLDGSYTESLGKAKKEHPCHGLAFRPAGLVHAHRSKSGGRCFNIHPVAHERFHAHQQWLRDPIELHSALLPWLLSRLYQEFVRPVDVSTQLALEGLALEIFAEAMRPPPRVLNRRPPRWLEQARDLLHDCFSDSFTVQEVAASVGANPAYLCRVFREHYRCTIGEYVRRLRVEWASCRLCAFDTPLAEIALDAGFVDQSHFTKTFKRLTGMTPAQFRAASRRLRRPNI